MGITLRFAPCRPQDGCDTRGARLGLFAALGAANAAVVGGWFFTSIVPVCAVCGANAAGDAFGIVACRAAIIVVLLWQFHFSLTGEEENL